MALKIGNGNKISKTNINSNNDNIEIGNKNKISKSGLGNQSKKSESTLKTIILNVIVSIIATGVIALVVGLFT